MKQFLQTGFGVGQHFLGVLQVVAGDEVLDIAQQLQIFLKNMNSDRSADTSETLNRLQLRKRRRSAPRNATSKRSSPKLSRQDAVLS